MIKNSKVLLFLIVILNSCTQTDNSQINESNKLIRNLDSLNNNLDSIRRSTPVLFNAALSLEKQNSDSALLIYNQIYTNDTNSFWALLSNERCAELNPKSSKSFMTESFEFFLQDTLILFFHDSKCGEWGGDRESIQIYLKRGSKQMKSHLIADYRKEIFDCEDLESAYDGRKLKYNLIEKGNIIIKPSDEMLIENCIIALASQKLRGKFVGHAGNISSVSFVSKNNKPELFISVYSYDSWKEFHQLKRVLLTR